MNHKRGKPKNSRAGCLMCKPQKGNGTKGSFKALRGSIQRVTLGHNQQLQEM